MLTASKPKLFVKDLAPRIGSELRADVGSLLSGEVATEMPYAMDSGRMMHRTTIQGDEPFA